MTSSDYAVVIPTTGRASLQRCLDALAAAGDPRPVEVLVVDDHLHTPDPLRVRTPGSLAGRLTILTTSGGRGPAAARNIGWRAAPSVPWIVFLNDDVEVEPHWCTRLDQDLRADPEIGGVQGLVSVPLPSGRPPTDRERSVADQVGARWTTADMAYRRDALIETGGFDERFRRAYRENSDLALRVQDAGWRLAVGCRCTKHAIRPTDRPISLRIQAGNADDALMSRLHGPDWYDRADAVRGQRRQQPALTAAAGAAVVAALSGRRRLALASAAGWLVGTVEFAFPRLRRGPRSAREAVTIALTSVLIPPVATAHRLRGVWRHRSAGSWPGRPAAVLFDRDGTLVTDVPYNADPAAVRPVPGAAEALRALREAGLRVGVVTNQSGVGRGLITEDDMKRVNARIEELLGPFDVWAVCAHAPEDGCDCRKPEPGLIEQAARTLGVPPTDCVVVGDIGSDVTAARAAGARSVLIPTPETRVEELAGTRLAPDLAAATRWILGTGGRR